MWEDDNEECIEQWSYLDLLGWMQSRKRMEKDRSGHLQNLLEWNITGWICSFRFDWHCDTVVDWHSDATPNNSHVPATLS
ncbi:unnamed protein product [Anisakis simplex]|uniref:Ovule protein n=1 Tax=Anisakis simplex TaxID=6269 RepID=A0A0M3K504_ANISI|nr:unnamed protein product [Anisakis simplex]